MTILILDEPRDKFTSEPELRQMLAEEAEKMGLETRKITCTDTATCKILRFAPLAAKNP